MATEKPTCRVAGPTMIRAKMPCSHLNRRRIEALASGTFQRLYNTLTHMLLAHHANASHDGP